MYVDGEISHIYIYADYKEISDKTFTAETKRGIHQWKKHSEFSLSLPYTQWKSTFTSSE